MRRLFAIIAGIAILMGSLGVEAAGSYSARTNYILMCQGCHLADGTGTPEKVPALKDEVGRFLQVAGGREYLIQVPGTSQSPLTDQEVAAVLNWILDNFSSTELPADFRPYTTAEVARFRYEPLANASEVRAGLLDKLRQRGS
jgi:hypothetical protein